MLIQILKAKIHRATVTGAELDYEGSLAVDPRLLKAAGLLVGEKVHVVNLNNGNRFETYLIKGKAGEVCLNGPAARLGVKGDKVIVIAYALAEPAEAAAYKPNIVFVTDSNRIKTVKK
jgi:aspartate 1-decarboxylase